MGLNMRVSLDKNIILLIALLSAMSVSLSSCGEGQAEEAVVTRIPIILTASQPVTRAGNDIQEAFFDENEKVNAFIRVHDGDWIGNPTVYTTSAPSGGLNKLVPDVQPFFPSSDAVVDVFALYPTTVGADDTEFSVASDQHTDAAYKASDLMYASSWGETVNSGVVNLQFTHKMAKLVVTATGDGGVEIAGIRLHQMYPTLGYSHSGGIYTSSGAKGTLTDIELANGGSVLIPPQEHAGFLLEVTTTDSKRAIYSLTNTKMFKAGKVYRLNVTVGPLNLGTGTAGDPEGVIDEWPDDVGTVTVAPMGSEGLVIDSVAPVIYKAAAWEPTPKVMFGSDTELHSPTDFTFQYFDNTNVGTAAVLVVGAGKYTGLVAIRSFEILRAEGKLQYANKTLSEYFAYNTVVPNALTITGDGDMHYTSSNNSVATVDATGVVRMQGVGHARITASMDAKNYTAATDTFHIEVKKKTISDDGGSGSGGGGSSSNTITIGFRDDVSSYVYTGQAIQPEMVVKDGNITLTKGTHYTVTYENNTNCSQYKDDNPTAIIHGQGGYEGTMSVRFAITQATPVLSFVDGNSGNANLSPGSELTRTAQSSIYGTTPSYSSSSTSVATVNSSGLIHAVADGETTITVSLAADNSAYKNWKAATSLTFKVYVITNIQDFERTTSGTYDWTCSYTGYYTVEVKGAGGGAYNGTNNPNGGNGGLMRGTIYVTKGTKWYIAVGGGGTGNNGNTHGTGGFNGGGDGGNGHTNKSWNGGCGGGGATHIATAKSASSTYLLKDYTTTDSRNTILIVAGGGGGASYNNEGGQGGGDNGGYGNTINDKNGLYNNAFNTTDTLKYIAGGNQTGTAPSGVTNKSYLFGQGGTGVLAYTGTQLSPSTNTAGTTLSPAEFRGTGGGGGGWYGGFAYQHEKHQFNASGGGGSGYIKTTSFIPSLILKEVGGGSSGGLGTATSSSTQRTGVDGQVKIVWRGTSQPTTDIN